MKWIIKEQKKEEVEFLTKTLNLTEIECKLLINRGQNSIEKIDYFLNRNFIFLENPFRFEEMPTAILRIKKAIENKENILIAGDRDVDGITSISILYRTLKGFGLNVYYSLPGPDQDYGFVPELFDICREKNISLVITVDNGIAEIENIKKLRELGIDTIITDHHIPLETLPEAVAIINPNLKETEYPCKYLSGGAVSFKLCQSLILSKNPEYNKTFLIVELLVSSKTYLLGKILGINYISIKNFQPVNFKIIIQEHLDEYEKIYGTAEEETKKVSEKQFITLLLDLFNNSDNIYLRNKIYSLDFLKELFDKYKLDFEKYLIKIKEIESNIIQYSSFCKNSLEGLAEGLIQKIFYEDIEFQLFNKKFVFIAALSIIGDVMSLIDESRILVKYGLNEIKNSIITGLNYLISYIQENSNSGVKEREELVNSIIPILNSARRMKLNEVSLNLLVSDNKEEIIAIINQLINLNNERKIKYNEYKEIIWEELYKQVNLEKDYILLIATDKIEHGVTGLIANKIKEEFNRPAIIFIIKEDIAQGTARSVDNFNILDAFEYCKDLIIKSGGHRTAAGLTILKENIEAFRKRINEYAEEFFKALPPTDILEIDCEIKLEEINKNLLEFIEKLKPFGKDNPPPIFTTRNITRMYKKCVGQNNEHLKLTIFNNNLKFDGIGFSLGKYAKYDYPFSLAYTIEKNVFNGNETIQLNIKDVIIERE